jgi:heterodisulfide reductase subunit A-like polyferredoxin
MKDEGKACPATDRKVMVIGAGVAGGATASALLDLGVEVVLVERSHSSGTVDPNQKEGKLLALNDSIVVGVERSDAFHIEVESTQIGCRQRSVHDVDAVILATGLVPVDAGLIPELGLGRLGNVISSSQLEELLVSSEAIRRPSDGGPISTVVFVQCVGSRVEKRGVPYCSAICCASAIRSAIMLKQRDPEVGVYVLYIDIRTAGKGEEAMYKQARQLDVKFIRGQPALVAKQPRSERLLVCGENTLLRELYEIEADLVVLAVGLREDPSNLELFHGLGVELDQEGLIKIGDSSDGAVSTSAKGVFVAGSASAPMGIDEARAMGTRAAHTASAYLRSLG